jgi:hypothetical protein
MSKVAILVMILVFPILLSQETMDNDAVIRLRKAGFAEEVIVATIQRSPGAYDTSVEGLSALKNAGVTDAEVRAVVAKGSAGTAQPALKPRVVLHAPNRSGGWSALVHPAMEMSKDFQEVCPGVRVSISLYVADYTVELNQVEHGVVAENQMLIANKDGDLISQVKEWGGLKGGVKKACAAILADWAKR